MKTWNKNLFFLVVILQIIILLGIVAKRYYLLSSPIIVKLKCQPIDPRSLLSGDYVRLSFNISRLRDSGATNLSSKTNFKEHEKIFVALVKSSTNDYWKAVAYSDKYSSLKDISSYIIQGEVIYPYWLSINYGVEEYFVPQNEGFKIEDNIRKKTEVEVEVTLSQSGESAIKKLYINNQEVKFY